MANADRRRRYYQKNRAEIIRMLGGACVCCGTTWKIFLQIDHVNSVGSQERRAISNCIAKLREFVRARPEDYQLLCANCHSAKTAEVPCPCKEDAPCLV